MKSPLQDRRDRMDKDAFDDYRDAADWVLDNWVCPDEGPPASLLAALESIRDWGDGAWHTAGQETERAEELRNTLRLAAGFLEFEGNSAAASRLIFDALQGKEPLFQHVAIDPSFADWTPDCHHCEKPIGNWANCWMLPAGPHEDELTGVVFIHRNCNLAGQEQT